MVKFLIILGIIIIAILLIVRAIRKKLEKIFQQFVPKQPTSSKETAFNEVLYEKDDVVVLKGEADGDMGKGKREKGEGS